MMKRSTWIRNPGCRYGYRAPGTARSLVAVERTPPIERLPHLPTGVLSAGAKGRGT